MNRITDWLRSESLPRSLYEMLGHPLLDPDRDALLLSIRTAIWELLEYQSHPEKAVSKRAMMLVTELGRCRGILEDEARHKVYVEEMVKTVREQFVAERGPHALHVGNDLVLWLVTVHSLPADAAERVAKLIRGKTVPPRPHSRREATLPAPAEPPSEGVEILELEDRLPPADRASHRSKTPQRSLAVPMAIACGVLAFAIVAVIVVMNRGGQEKVAKADPPAVQTPPSAPEPKTPKPEEKKKFETVPSKKPDSLPKPIESDPTPPDPPSPKKPDFSPKPVEPDSTPPVPETKPVPKPKVESKPVEPKFDRSEWTAATDGNPNFLVKDVFMRIHSVEIRQLTDTEKNEVSKPLLVIWLEATNQGSAARRCRRLIDWQNIDDDFYQYCNLHDDSKANGEIKRPRWLTFDRKKIEGIPNWYEDDNANRLIAPKKQTLIPIIYEKPMVPTKDLTLKINAVRIVEQRGSGTEYGWFILQIRETHWKK